MMKTRFLIPPILCVIMTISLVFALEGQTGKRFTQNRIPFVDPDVKLTDNKINTSGNKNVPRHRMSDQSPIDTLSWRRLSEPEMNFSAFTWGDSLAMWFNPLAACTVKEIRIYNINFEGNMFISLKDAKYDGHIFTKDSTDVNGWIGTFEGSQWIPGNVMGYPPTGDLLWGPFPLTVTDNDADSWITLATAPAGEPALDGEPFFVAIEAYLTEGWGIAGEFDAPLPYHFFKYYSGDEGIGGGPNGWYLRSFTLWVEIVVEYYENTRPVISEVEDLQFTYAPGPYPVKAHIEDWDFEIPERAGVASAYLHWNVEGLEDSIFMMGPTGENIYSGEIPPVSPGDTVHYHISAVDEMGLRSNTAPLTFARLEPDHPGSDILLVEQGVSDRYDWYAALLDSLDYSYEYWNIMNRKGIDESVLDWGWDTVILFGYAFIGGVQIPTRDYDNNIWAGFLDAGNSLLYVDDLYFWLTGEPDVPIFDPGDFVYDYFGLESGLTDASNYWDPVLYGVPDDPVSGDFVDTPIEQTWLLPSYNWIAYTQASEAGTDIFFNEYGDGCGSRYSDGHFKTIFLPWILDGLLEDTGTDTVPKASVYRLMQNILDWFETRQSVMKGDVTKDGQINVLDVLRGANIILNQPPEPSESELWAADCNGDETVNVLDLIGIVNVILGISECVPVD